jgi:putative DNA primase/helicase
VTIATNRLPKIVDTSLGVWRRVMLMPFRFSVQDEKRDPMLVDRLQAELPGILNWALEGLRRLRQQGQFTVSAVNREALDQYRQESNPVRMFLEDHTTEEAGARHPCANLYAQYAGWCRDNGHLPPVDEKQFGKELKRVYPRVDRKRRQEGEHRVYVYEGLTVQEPYVPQGPIPASDSEG